MLEKTWSAICRHQLFDPGDKVVLAVSGGADSMAMLHIIHALRGRLDLILHVAHLNHMMRGQEAREDADFVSSIAGALGIPFTLGEADVPEMIATRRLSPEEAAREARYDFLFRTARKQGADKIAVAHHGDDQAETLLMHLINGTGLEGLVGMRPKTGCIVRPLLEFRREDIEEYCREAGIRFRQDASNEDQVYFRNKIRHRLLPVLTEYNPNIVETLMRTAEIIRAENDYLEKKTALAFKKAVKAAENPVSLDSGNFGRLDTALQRRLVRSIFQAVCGENDTLDFAQVERVREFILSGQTGKKIELPQKLIAEKGYNEVFFMPRDTDISGEEIPWDPRLVAVPGITELPQANVRVSAEILTAAQAGEKVFSASRWEAYMDWDKIEPPLVAAPRTEGCVFHPLGSPGRKSLKEFFIDAKVPGRERGKIPIISDRQGILWVAGHRMDERIKVTDSTQRVLRLQMMKTGNTG